MGATRNNIKFVARAFKIHRNIVDEISLDELLDKRRARAIAIKLDFIAETTNKFHVLHEPIAMQGTLAARENKGIQLPPTAFGKVDELLRIERLPFIFDNIAVVSIRTDKIAAVVKKNSREPPRVIE